MPNAKLTQYLLLFSGVASHVYRSINGLVRLCLASTHEADTYFGAKKKGNVFKSLMEMAPEMAGRECAASA